MMICIRVNQCYPYAINSVNIRFFFQSGFVSGQNCREKFIFYFHPSITEKNNFLFFDFFKIFKIANL